MTPAERIGVARTLLFVPAARPDRFDRALATAADCVILDLEASVRPVDKARARDAVREWLARCAAPQRVLVRVNPIASDHFVDDVASIHGFAIAGVVLAMASHVADVRAAVDAVGGTPVVALIENAEGVLDAPAIARVGGVVRLAFGNMDYATDTGTRGRESTIYPAARLVLASRAANLAAPIAGVTAAFRDPRLLADETAWERDHGFGAKFCIHPDQLAVVERVLAPTTAELAWAARVIAAASDSFACEVDGELVDRPVVERAHRIAATAKGR